MPPLDDTTTDDETPQPLMSRDAVMQGIARARAAGFSDDDIMGRLGSAPQFAPNLTRARQAGFSDDEIWSHLGLKRSDPGLIGALTKGTAAGIRGLGQTAEAVTGGKPQAQEDTSIAAQPIGWGDFLHPVTLTEKSLYGLGKSAPTMAGAIIGGTAGTLVGGGPETPAGVVGGLLGTAGGAAAASVAQSLGPSFAQELKANPDDPDGAFDRALTRAGTEGLISGVAFSAFELAPFRSAVRGMLFKAFGVSDQAALTAALKAGKGVVDPAALAAAKTAGRTAGVKDLALQATTIQPGIGMAGQAVQNIEDGKDPTDGLLESYPGQVAGVLTPLVGTEAAKFAGRRAMNRLRGRGAETGTDTGAGAIGANGTIGAPPDVTLPVGEEVGAAPQYGAEVDPETGHWHVLGPDGNRVPGAFESREDAQAAADRLSLTTPPPAPSDEGADILGNGEPPPPTELEQMEQNQRQAKRAPLPKKPQSLLEYLSASPEAGGLGGVQDDGGDLAAMEAHKWHLAKPFRPRLMRQDGVPLDYAREAAVEAGFGDWQTLGEFKEAIRQELSGKPIYKADEAEQAKKRKDQEAVQEPVEDQIRRRAHELGIDSTLPLEDLLDHITEREAIESVESPRDADRLADTQEQGEYLEYLRIAWPAMYDDMVREGLADELPPPEGQHGEREPASEVEAQPATAAVAGAAPRGAGAQPAPAPHPGDHGEGPAPHPAAAVHGAAAATPEPEVAAGTTIGPENNEAIQQAAKLQAEREAEARGEKVAGHPAQSFAEIERQQREREAGENPPPAEPPLMAELVEMRDTFRAQGMTEDAARIEAEIARRVAAGQRAPPEPQLVSSTEQPTSKKPRPQLERSDWTEIGKNRAGETVYEDQRGVRSILRPNGIRASEPVQIVPGRGISVPEPAKKPEEYQLASVHPVEAEKGRQPEVEPPKAAAPAPAETAEPAEWSNLTHAGRKKAALAAGYPEKEAERLSKMAWQHLPAETAGRLVEGARKVVADEEKERTGAQTAERPKDANGRPIFKEGERVVIPDGHLGGRHGTVAEVHSLTMQPIFGGRPSEPSYTYVVKTDQGAQTHATKLEPESGERPEAVPDPVHAGIPVEPKQLADQVGYAKRDAEKYRAVAARARKAENKRAQLQNAAASDRRAAEQQRILDEWKAKYPDEAKRIFGEAKAAPEAKPAAEAPQAAGMSLVETRHTRDGYPLFVVSLTDRVERGRFDELKAAAKEGGGWYSSFRGNGAVPGFQFKDREKALAFMREQGGGEAKGAEKPATAQQPVPKPEERPAAPPPAAEPPAAKPEFGADNKFFTKDAADRAREILRKKAQQLNTGFDPEMAFAGLQLSGFYIEGGLRKFGAFAHQMLEDLGEWARPHLRQWYNAVRDQHGFDTEGMSSREEVEGWYQKNAEIDAKADAADTEPTDRQKEAGNYQKGHVNFQGLDVTIENPRGSTRSGIGPDGKPWSVEMPDHYGYIKKTEGADGDHVDAFIGNHPDAPNAYVIDQVDADSGAFDEHKVMLGYPSPEAAVEAYRRAFSDGRAEERFSAMTELPLDDLKQWLKGDTTKPLADLAPPEATQPGGLPPAAAPPKSKKTKQAENGQPSLFDNDRPGTPGNGAAGEPEAPAGGEPAGQPQPSGTGPVVGGAPPRNGGAAQPAGHPATPGARPGEPGVGGVSGGSAPGSAPDGRPGGSGEGVAPQGRGGKAPRPAATRPNFHITDPKALIGGAPRERFARNRKAIESVQSILAEGREPTADELAAMAGYTGWGAFGQELFQGSWDRPRPRQGWEQENEWLRDHLGEDAWKAAQASIINAHYTDPPTVQALWDMVRHMGFQGGRVLEPSMGIGNFFGLMPRDLMAQSRLTGIELDPTTGSMARLLYPEANVQIKGYEKSKTPDDFYDLVIGNWPFAAQSPADRRYDNLGPTLHDYFFLKALDQTRPGGLVIGITSNGTMDKMGRATRLELAKKGDLIAAYRLPSGAFKEYAGTSVVADVLVFKKRAEPNAEAAHEPWIESIKHQLEGGEINLNRYWLDHPDHILGDLAFGHGTTAGREGMTVTPRPDFAEVLKALPERLPVDGYTPITRGQEPRFVANNTEDRHGAVTLGKDDNRLYVIRGDQMAPLEDLSKSITVGSKVEQARRQQQVRGLIGLRRAYGALIDAERDGKPETEDLRKELRRQYQAFQREHGFIHSSTGLKILHEVDDPFVDTLRALENRDGSPARIMSEATVRSTKRLEKPDVRQAFVMARNESATLDLDRIAELSGSDPEAVADELRKAGAIYRTPGGGHEVADVYLSGNVRRKLREAEEAAENGEDMGESIAALKKVMPPDLPYYLIGAKLGANWIPADVYKRFAADMLGIPMDRAAEDVEARYHLGHWRFHFKDRSLNDRPEATSQWGHSRYQFDRLIDAAMNNRNVKIMRYDPDLKYDVLDVPATEEVNEKIQNLRDHFEGWVWTDPDRRLDLEKLYGEAINYAAKPIYDGSFLEFPGMALLRGNDPFNMRKHQVDAVWRGIVNRAGTYAHEVGTGKTYTLGALAVESRRYGIARKPLAIAHNANSASVAREVQAQYPGARILYVDNLAPDRIGETLHRIANDDWDLVVVPHSLLDRFALKEETLKALTASDIAALEEEALAAAADDNVQLTVDDMDDPEAMKKVRSVTAKQLVKARNQIIAMVQKWANRAQREGAVPFEDLGVDMIIVDEAHEFKKPPIATRMKVKGLNVNPSNRSIALKLLTDYIHNLNGGKGVHLFTGTPITNTLNESFNMMKYVMGDEMARAGVQDWDSWFNTFAEASNEVELSAAGDYEPVTRLNKFVNVDELARMAGQYTDVVFADEMPEFRPREIAGKTMGSADLTDKERDHLLNGRTENPVGRPYKKVINDIAEMSPQQREIFAYLQQLSQEWKNARGKQRLQWMKSGDPHSPVLIETNAAKASLDHRLYDMTLGQDWKDSKVNRAVKNIMEVYNSDPRATQAVFMDKGYSDSSSRTEVDNQGNKTKRTVETLNVADDLVSKLVKAGFPRDQIKIVDGSVSKVKRDEIAQKMNRSEVRLVIGLTNTLGTGVNMQDNLRAMHHIDAPWMPGELEQRNGRGWRQGNKWNTVLEYRYITEGIDGRRWQVLSTKDRFIKQFLQAMKNKSPELMREIEGDATQVGDDDSDIMSTLSEAAGDPRLLLTHKLGSDIRRLERRQLLHHTGTHDAIDRARRLVREIQNAELHGELLGRDTERYKAARDALDGQFHIEIGGRQYTERKEGGQALASVLAGLPRDATNETTEHAIGSFMGFPLVATFGRYAEKPTLEIRGGKAKDGAYAAYPTTGSLASIEGVMRSRLSGPGREEQLRHIEDLKASRQRLLEMAKQPFPQGEKLIQKRQQLAELQHDVEVNPQPPPSWLRHGAPVGSLVYLPEPVDLVEARRRREAGEPVPAGRRAVPVEGHRWTPENWFVMTPDGPVPYTELQDENGDRLFEPREFKAPVQRQSPLAIGQRVMIGERGAEIRKLGTERAPDGTPVHLVRYDNGEQSEVPESRMTRLGGTLTEGRRVIVGDYNRPGTLTELNYRRQVLANNTPGPGTHHRVRFDDGEEQTVPIGDIRPMPPGFKAPPPKDASPELKQLILAWTAHLDALNEANKAPDAKERELWNKIIAQAQKENFTEADMNRAMNQRFDWQEEAQEALGREPEPEFPDESGGEYNVAYQRAPTDEVQTERGMGQAMPEGQWRRLAPGLVGEPPSAEGEALRQRVEAILRKMVPEAEPRAYERMVSTGEHGELGQVYGAHYRVRNSGGIRHVIAWSLASKDTEGTVRHEAVHYLRRAGLLTQGEWETLAKAARDGNWLEHYKIEKRYHDLSMGQQTEEAVAEAFADWRRNRGVWRQEGREVPALLRPIWNKVDLFLRRVAAAARELFGKDATAEDIFAKMESGSVGRRVPDAEGRRIAAAYQRPPEEEPSIADEVLRSLGPEEELRTRAPTGTEPEQARTGSEGAQHEDNLTHEIGALTGGRGPSTEERVLNRVALPKGATGLKNLNPVERMTIFPRTLAALDRMSSALWQAWKNRQTEGVRALEEWRKLVPTFLTLADKERERVYGALELDRIFQHRRPAEGPIRVKNTSTWFARKTKPGQEYTLSDKEAKAYRELVTLGDAQWDHLMDATAKRFGWKGKADANAIAKAARDAGTEGERKHLARLASLMHLMSQQKQAVYFPMMRFGDHYIAIRPKPGTEIGYMGGHPKIAWFETVERSGLQDLLGLSDKADGRAAARIGIDRVMRDRLAELRQRFPADKFDVETGQITKKPDILRSIDIPAIEKLFSMLENNVQAEIIKNTFAAEAEAMEREGRAPTTAEVAAMKAGVARYDSAGRISGGTAKEAYQDLLGQTLDALHRLMYEQMKAGFKKKARVVPGYCVAPETKLLTADMRWVEAASVAVGDELVGFEEMAATANGRRRRMKIAIVKAVKEITKPRYRITLASGRSIIVSDNHQFIFIRSGLGGGKWRQAKDLRVGDTLKIFPMERSRDDYEAGWFAGLLDGEGWITRPSKAKRKVGVRLGWAQLPGAVLDRSLRIASTAGIKVYECEVPNNGRAYNVSLPAWDAMRILQIFRPLRLIDQRRWVDSPLPQRRATDNIVAIEKLDEGRVLAIETSCHTFIAEGICSHNSSDFDRAIPAHMSQMARHAADLIHRDNIEAAYQNIQDRHPHQAVRDFWQKWRQYQEEPANPLSRMAQSSAQLGFTYALAMNPSSSAVFATHTPLAAAPALSLGLGRGRAVGELRRALTHTYSKAAFDTKYGAHIKIDQLGQTPAERSFVQGLARDGMLHAAGARDLEALTERQSQLWGQMRGTMRRAFDIAVSNISVVDQANRAATALAFFRAAQKPETRAKMAEAWKDNQVFRRMVEEGGLTPETMGRFGLSEAGFEWGKMNQARMMRGAGGTLLFTLHGFQTRFLSAAFKLMKNMGPAGRMAALWMMAGLWAGAGAEGLPFTQDLENAADWIWKEVSGHDPMISYRIRAMLADAGFGKVGAEAIMRGPIGTFLGVDLASRIGFGDIISRELEGGGINALGTVPSIIAGRLMAANKRYQSGQGAGAAAAELLPAGLRNPARAARIGEEGLKSQSGKTTYIPKGKITAAEQGEQALGFRPLAAERAYEQGDYRYRAKRAKGPVPRDAIPNP